MEELYVCAILCGLDLEKGDKYREKLEQLLELNPQMKSLKCIPFYRQVLRGNPS